MPGARARAERGELAFGTVDSYLLWRLTGGRVHATDATNASRTLLFDIHTGEWDDDLLKLLRVPRVDAAGGAGLLPPSSATPSRSCSAAPIADLAASPATSRRRPSARPASRRA